MARRQPDLYNGPVVQGIDISKWQGEVDWKKVATDPRIKFGISRTGDGRSRDKFFEKNWKESGEAGLIRGSYHYFRADRDGQFQAELVLDMIEKAGGLLPTDLPPTLDIEGGANKNLPGGVIAGTEDLPIDFVVEECLEFLEILERGSGSTPLVYAGQAFHWWIAQKRPQLAVEFEKYPLWVPSYNRTAAKIPANTAGDLFPWKRWSIWQYTPKGQVDGAKTPVDMNKFRGDEEAFKKFISSLQHDTSDAPGIDEQEAIRAEINCLTERLVSLVNSLD